MTASAPREDIPIDAAVSRAEAGAFRWLAAVGGLAGAAWLLAVAAPDSLVPPLGSWAGLMEWVEGTSPPLLAMALVRLAGLVACGYVGLILLVAMVAEAAGWWRLAERLARITPAALRQLVVGGAQLSLTAGTTLGLLSSLRPVPAAAGEPPPATAVLTQLDPDASGTAPPPATATMVQLGPDDTAAEPRPTSPAEALPAAPEPEPPVSPAPTAPSSATWTVGAGDSFWSIAESILTEAPAAVRPSEADIARYWCRLITANQDRLIAPGHPDLLLPGQTLAVPAPE